MKQKLFSLLALCIILTVLTGCMETHKTDPYGLSGKTHPAVTPADRNNLEWWAKRHKGVLERVVKGNVDLIFVGDSITHGWDNQELWNKYYAPRNAVNMGFGGDSTQHVLWRLDNGEIDGISPKLAILMIGTNNSNGPPTARWYNTAEEIADGIKAICSEMQLKLPKTKILILAIFPRGNSEQRKDKEHGATYNPQWAKNDKASELASKIADNKHIFYLDINKAFLDKNSVLSRDIMPDLLHPNEKGYKIWAEAIEPTVKKLMGEK